MIENSVTSVSDEQQYRYFRFEGNGVLIQESHPHDFEEAFVNAIEDHDARLARSELPELDPRLSKAAVVASDYIFGFYGIRPEATVFQHEPGSLESIGLCDAYGQVHIDSSLFKVSADEALVDHLLVTSMIHEYSHSLGSAMEATGIRYKDGATYGTLWNPNRLYKLRTDQANSGITGNFFEEVFAEQAPIKFRGELPQYSQLNTLTVEFTSDDGAESEFITIKSTHAELSPSVKPVDKKIPKESIGFSVSGVYASVFEMINKKTALDLWGLLTATRLSTDVTERNQSWRTLVAEINGVLPGLYQKLRDQEFGKNGEGADSLLFEAARFYNEIESMLLKET